jgi:crotonobetainyl-CoA:carnitine CoA-transferase CaiB-like acyl-CoA transferase
VRVKNRKTLNRDIQDLIGCDTRDSWIKKLDDGGVPNTPLQTVDQVVRHPQTVALGMLQSSPDGKMNLMGVPLSFDGKRPEFLRSPPELGQHTQTILHKETDDQNDQN